MDDGHGVEAVNYRTASAKQKITFVHTLLPVKIAYFLPDLPYMQSLKATGKS